MSPEKVGAQRHHAVQLTARSNVFVERLWRSVKYERVYLKAYDGVSAARADIADYMGWYNAVRVHSSLDEVSPDEHYFAHLPALAKAA